LLLTEPLGVVYFKYNPFDTKLFPMLPDNIPNIDLSKIKFALRPIKARGFIDLGKGLKSFLVFFLEFLVKNIKEKKNKFQLCTQYRNWKFRAANIAERDEWIEAIKKLQIDQLNAPQEGVVNLEEIEV
jgi:hypothetical protein